MSIPREINKYQQGETIVLEIEYRNPTTDALTDPDEVDLTVINPDDTELVTDQDATHGSTGKYSYDINSASDAQIGTYKVRWRAKAGTRYKIDKDVFEIEA